MTKPNEQRFTKPAIKERNLKGIPPQLLEIEQGFVLNREIEQDDETKLCLRETLEEACEDEKSWRKVGTISQAVISPEQIPKTRLRILHDDDDHVQAVITFKSINTNEAGNKDLKPRLEIDLPIDLKKLEEMYAHVQKPDGSQWHASDSLQQLVDFGSYGMVHKDRYKFCDKKNKRTLDVDLYRWGEGVMDVVQQAAEDAVRAAGETGKKALKAARDAAVELYDDLALIDVELQKGDYINSAKDFPELIRPFLVTNGKKEKLFEVTGDGRFKGRRLTGYEGSAGNFLIDPKTCELMDKIAAESGKSK